MTHSLATHFKRIDLSRVTRLWRQPSLRTHIVFLLLLATMPLAAVMSYQIFSGMEREEAKRAQMLSSASFSLALTIERELNSSVDALTAIALSESLHDGELNRFEGSLRSAGRLRSGWRGVFLMDLDGRLMFDTAQPAHRMERNALAAVPELLRMGTQPHSLVSNLVVDRSTQRYSSVVAVPVTIDGTLRYVLGAWIPVEAWQALLERGLGSASVMAMLYDRDRRIIAETSGAGRLVAHPVPAPIPADEPEGTGRVTMPGVGDSFASWHRVPSSGWRVSVALPAEPIKRAQQRIVLGAVVTASGCLLLGISLALFAARHMTTSLKRLADGEDVDSRRPVRVLEIALLRDALREARQRDESARAALQAKADEFETLFHNTPIGLTLAHDPACARVTQNPAMEALFGPFEDASKGGQRVLSNGVDVVFDRWPLCIAAQTGEAVPTVQLDLARPGQPTRRVLASATPLRDASGRSRGAIAAMVDITEQMHIEARLQRSDRRLRQSERLVELAQEAGTVGFFDYQFEHDLLTWTAGQATLFGVDAGRLESTLVELLVCVNSEDRTGIERSMGRIFAARKESETFDYRVRQGSGVERWLSTYLSIRYSPQGAPAHMVGVTVDVTDRKRAEQARQALIEREQMELEKAAAAHRAKDEFLAMLGHELRNPLSAISFAVGVLRRDPTPEMSDSACEIVERQIRHLSQKVAEMLSMTHVMSEQGPSLRQKLDLAALVQRVITRLQSGEEAAAHRLLLDLAEAPVEVDPEHIEQVIVHLVDNALKYTPAGSEVTIVVRREGDQALLQVRDNGPGISPELLPHVFELFVQGERPIDRQVGGLGIGLTLVKRLVEKASGTVTAQSSSAGSLFEVRLPAISAREIVVGKEWSSGAQSRCSVLVIEDNPDALKSLRDLLSLDGHRVSSAGDGEAGLQALLTQRPDVAIVDIGLPKLDGLQVATRARAGGYAGRMIALTGYGQEKDIKRSLKAGFDAHLVKPLQPAQLREEISHA